MQQTMMAPPVDEFYLKADELPIEPTTESGDEAPVMKWVAHLLNDLSADDFSMVLMDLMQLQSLVHSRVSEAPKEYTAQSVQDYFSPFAPTDVFTAGDTKQAVIYSEDGELAIDLCEGPEATGDCPRTMTPSGCVQCAGLWLGSSGWKFKVAEDAHACPLMIVGFA